MNSKFECNWFTAGSTFLSSDVCVEWGTSSTYLAKLLRTLWVNWHLHSHCPSNSKRLDMVELVDETIPCNFCRRSNNFWCYWFATASTRAFHFLCCFGHVNEEVSQVIFDLFHPDIGKENSKWGTHGRFVNLFLPFPIVQKMIFVNAISNNSLNMSLSEVGSKSDAWSVSTASLVDSFIGTLVWRL